MISPALAQAPNIETLLPLTSDESRRLRECEGVIQRGLDTFYEVGNALAKIRDDRLYRIKYATFEDYCRERWRMSKTHANRLIDSSEVIANLTPIGVTPTNEAQARELASLEPDVQRAVWQIAVSTAPTNDKGEPVLTAAHIKAVAEDLTDVVRQRRFARETMEDEGEEKERKPRQTSDRSEVEALYDPEIQARLGRYIETITEFENMDWPVELHYLRRMFQLHKSHANFQKTRNVAEDCDVALRILKKLTPDPEMGFEIAAQEHYDWLFDLGYCMSKKEYTSRLKHMSEDTVRMALFTTAGDDGKQEERRGVLPGIVCLPWVRVRKRDKTRDEDDEDF